MKASEWTRNILEHLRESKWVQGFMGTSHADPDLEHTHCLLGAMACVSLPQHLNYTDANLDNRASELTVFPEVMTFLGTFENVAQEQHNLSEKVLPVSINDHVVENFEELERLLEKTAIQLEEKGE